MEREIPCRVTAELRAWEREQEERELPEFTYLEEDFRQVVTKEIAEPLELLFSTRDQVEAVIGSYGPESVNTAKAVEWLMKDIKRLEEKILELWENA